MSDAVAPANLTKEEVKPTKAKLFSTFEEFYPFYIGEHQDSVCRRLHVVGTTLVVAVAAKAVLERRPANLALVPVVGYTFAWIGHFFFEKNRPATFTYPIYSLMGDFRMWFEIVTGKRAF